jgi:hypothetical protein
MMTTLTADLIGLILLGLGAIVALAVRRAVHRRTNKYGVEGFHSFAAKLRAQFGDHISIGAAIVLLSAGAIVLALNHVDSWGWIVIAPVAVVMLYLLVGLT